MQWYHKFLYLVVENEFLMSEKVYCMYTKMFGLDFMLMTFYVDDILITENSMVFLT